jgi:hypothetical protein
LRKIVSLVMLTLLLAGIVSYSSRNMIVHAQQRADAVQANPQSISWTYPTHAPGETFIVYVDVINVIGLFAFQCGFRYDPTVLRMLNVEVVIFPPNYFIPMPGIIDPPNGIVTAWGGMAIDPAYAKSGSGHLLKITMQINPALWPPYSGTYPGTPVPMIDLTDADGDPCELKLIYTDGVTEITPMSDHIYDGSFTLSVIEGDVNYDGIVNIMDATEVGYYWLQTVPPAPPDVDVSRDGVINVIDATIIGLHWLEHI